MLVDEGRKAFTLHGQQLHVLHVFLAGAGVAVFVNAAMYKLHDDRFVFDLIKFHPGISRIVFFVLFHTIANKNNLPSSGWGINCAGNKAKHPAP